MEIRKRNGESVPFQQEKIFNAMKKAFDGQGKEIGSREMDEILATVLNNLSVTVPLTVERVQDEVERTLMERGYYEVAKAYILYREKRSALRRVRHTIAQTVGDNSLDEVLRRIQMDFTEEVYSLAALQMKFESFCRPGKMCIRDSCWTSARRGSISGGIWTAFGTFPWTICGSIWTS